MKVQTAALTFIALAASTDAFAPQPVGRTNVAMNDLAGGLDLPSIEAELNYKPGKADTAFAKKYGHLAGASVRTVGEAFAEFTSELGYTVNALYKNMVTDIVGTTHLIVVNARFTKDPLWSLGILTSLDLLLKNYPEADTGAKIISALFKSVGLDEAEIRAEAKTVSDWAEGKTKADIEAALSGEDPSSPLGSIAASIKDDEFWMYSRYFGIGLVRLMDTVGIEMDKDEVYPIMEDWMKTKLGKSHLTACNDSDLYFRIKDKLDMMETMMKEIEIREKKRMAERLEEKAEQALRAAEREEKMKVEIELEAQGNRERVETE
jgi:photosystem II biogenesis protein Psp29